MLPTHEVFAGGFPAATPNIPSVHFGRKGEMPVGNPIFYGSVQMLFYRERNGKKETLLLKRRNTGFEDGKWSVVAGRMDGGEEVISAAIREVYEEAGLVLEPSDLEVIGVMHRRNLTYEWMDFFLLIRRWNGEPVNKEPHKCEELRWFPLDSLPDGVIPYIRKGVLHDHSRMWFEGEGWTPALHPNALHNTQV
jgi:8-oxo-dGTP diphosphatase